MNDATDTIKQFQALRADLAALNTKTLQIIEHAALTLDADPHSDILDFEAAAARYLGGSAELAHQAATMAAELLDARGVAECLECLAHGPRHVAGQCTKAA